MRALIVAAGGGGDAVAAVMVDAALGGRGEPAVVLTWAWDRLMGGMVPGPWGPDGFRGLRQLTPNVYAVTAGSEGVPAAGSALPRLAREVPQTLALIDPRYGVRGVARQIAELVERTEPGTVDVVDVGGDILARGDEVTLRTPLADAVVLAACRQAGVPVRLLIAGPGLDGEVPAGELRGVLGRNVLTLAPEHVDKVSGVLEWHPSEATAMLAATARGIRGMCEVSGTGEPVPLTDEGPTVHQVGLDVALRRNRFARAVASATTLAEADRVGREVCGFSEIDRERAVIAYERAMADHEGRGGGRAEADRREAPGVPVLDPEVVIGRLARFEHEARARGASHTTFGRLAEALGLRRVRREDLRSLLVERRPEQYAAPLWHIPPMA
ncbi:DUF1152 domain-containing protein [Streptomyces sp. NPDC055078]